MKWRRPGIWLGLASALLVVAFVMWDSKRISVGPLSAVHEHARAGLEDDCEACHGSGGSSMASACAGCHADIARQIEARTGLHGTITADVSRCGTCHSEHHGPDHAINSPFSFAQAGIKDRAAFLHEGLSYQLVGDHTTLSCQRCHEHANDAELAAGTKRFLGESQACAGCHRDPHQGHLPECASCHGQSEPFATVAEFVHPQSFALSGRHAGVGCLTCHPKDGPYAIEASGIAGGTGRAIKTARNCQDCHASPHSQDFVSAVARTLALDLGAACASCHSPENGAFRGSSARMDRTLHALTGFELVPPHAEASCTQCHAAGPLMPVPAADAGSEERFRALHPGRRQEECSACHTDPHDGQFASGPFAGANCRACHDATRFAPAAFGISEHARTSFPLSGGHEAVACAACHTQPSPSSPRLFHGTSSACASCHVDAHAGFFERTSVPAIYRGEAGCARCHDTSTFGPVQTRPFDHALWTGFALAGSHARSECTACHPRSKSADDTGRSFGRVAQAFAGPPQECATCHADVHAGRIGPENPPGIMTMGAGCARCHDVESFRGARTAFAHAAWTRFDLTGAHARAECEACHVPRDRADEHGRRFGLVSDRFPGPIDRCDTCHVDVHAGAFAKSGCESCHTTETFNSVPQASFDHGRATGFALDGAHARAECTACHAPTDAGAGRTFGRRARFEVPGLSRGFPRRSIRGERAHGLRALPRAERDVRAPAFRSRA
jgi:hypothetical protein